MPKPNYAFAKRQRELEKKRKKEEKAQRKDAPPEGLQDTVREAAGGEAPPAGPPAAPAE